MVAAGTALQWLSERNQSPGADTNVAPPYIPLLVTFLVNLGFSSLHLLQNFTISRPLWLGARGRLPLPAPSLPATPQRLWPSDQTLFDKHLRLAFLAMFDRFAKSQNIAWQAESPCYVLKNCNNIFCSSQAKHFDKQCSRLGQTANNFAWQANFRNLINSVR